MDIDMDIDTRHQKTSTSLATTTIVIIALGSFLNVISGCLAFYWKQLPWTVCRLIQHMVACNLMHLLLAGSYELISNKEVQNILSQARIAERSIGEISECDCRMVYPILSVTVNNPNLVILAIFAYYVYKTRHDSYREVSLYDSRGTNTSTMSWSEGGKISEKTVKALLVVGWMFSFFLFSPQIFVTDLTQVGQDCLRDDYTEMFDMRSSYWIGVLYFQVNVFTITCIYISISWRSLAKMQSNQTLKSTKTSIRTSNTHLFQRQSLFLTPSY